MGLLRSEAEEIVGHADASEHHLTLLAIEIRGESGQIELGEEGALEDRVHAVDSAQLRFLDLVIQHSAIASATFFHLSLSLSISISIPQETNLSLFVSVFPLKGSNMYVCGKERSDNADPLIKISCKAVAGRHLDQEEMRCLAKSTRPMVLGH